VLFFTTSSHIIEMCLSPTTQKPMHRFNTDECKAVCCGLSWLSKIANLHITHTHTHTHTNTKHTLSLKSFGIIKIFGKLMLLFSKDEFNWSNMTVKTFIMLQNISISAKYCFFFLLSSHQIILTFYSQKYEHNCFKIHLKNKKCFLSSKSAMISDHQQCGSFIYASRNKSQFKMYYCKIEKSCF